MRWLPRANRRERVRTDAAERRSAHVERAVLATATAFMLGLAIPILMLHDLAAPEWSEAVGFSYAIVLYAALRLSYFSYKGGRNLLEMTFWIFTYVWIGLAPMLQFAAGQSAWAYGHTPEQIGTALSIVALGTLAYEAGHLGSRLRRRNGGPAFIDMKLTPVKFHAFGGMALLCALLGSWILGWDFLVTARNEYDGAAAGDQALFLVVYAVSRSPLLVCWVVALAERQRARQFGVRPYVSPVWLAVLTVCVAVLFNPIPTPRLWVGTVALSGCFLWMRWRRVSFGRITLSIVVGALIVFPYADLYRNSTKDAELSFENISDPLVYKGDYDAFQQIVATTVLVEHQGYSAGRQLITSCCLFWVPRSFWPAKTRGTGELAGQALGLEYLNLSCPLWAELWVDFGFPGLVLLFGLFGYASGRLQLGYLEALRQERPTWHRAAVPLLAAYQPFLLRGDLLNASAFISLVLVMFLFFASRRRAKGVRSSRNAPRRHAALPAMLSAARPGTGGVMAAQQPSHEALS